MVPAAPALAADDASISGTVTVIDAGWPATYAEAVPLDGGPSYGAEVEFEEWGSWTGEYTIVDLPAGDYRVRFSAIELEADTGDVFLDNWWDHVDSESDASIVTVREGEHLTGFDGEIRPNPSVYGQIDGLDTDAVRVDVYAYNPDLDLSVTSMVHDGGYSLTGLRPGRWQVSFYPDDDRYVPRWWNGTPTGAVSEPGAVFVDVGDSEYRDLGVTTLEQGGLVRTTVDAPIGGAADGLTVNVYRKSGSAFTKLVSQVRSDDGKAAEFHLAAGDYTFEYVDPSGRYQTQFWKGATTLAGATVVTVKARSSVTQAVVMQPKPLPLTATPTPTISGIPAVGRTLTATTGSWKPAPVSLGYQWSRGGAPISGATKATYSLQPADLGKTISVSVTGTRAGYIAATKTSQVTAKVAAGTLTSAIPSVTGVPKVGTALGVRAGTWGPAPVTLNYQWKRSGVAIPGATASTFMTGVADLGKTITVTVTGSKAGYSPKSSTGKPVTIAKGDLASVRPTIAGTAAVGNTLTSKPGAWGPSPVSFTYQWKRGDTKIAGATRSTYRLTLADAGAKITVSVTGKKSGYTDSTRTSPSTAGVKRQLTASPVPSISGTPRVGSSLKVTTGSWAPQPVTLVTQWKRNGVAIAGATASVYKLVPADRGKTITVTVVGSKSGYASLTRTSAATSTVK
jgi:hypothetical protein